MSAWVGQRVGALLGLNRPFNESSRMEGEEMDHTIDSSHDYDYRPDSRLSTASSRLSSSAQQSDRLLRSSCSRTRGVTGECSCTDSGLEFGPLRQSSSHLLLTGHKKRRRRSSGRSSASRVSLTSHNIPAATTSPLLKKTQFVPHQDQDQDYHLFNATEEPIDRQPFYRPIRTNRESVDTTSGTRQLFTAINTQDFVNSLSEPGREVNNNHRNDGSFNEEGIYLKRYRNMSTASKDPYSRNFKTPQRGPSVRREILNGSHESNGDRDDNLSTTSLAGDGSPTNYPLRSSCDGYNCPVGCEIHKKRQRARRGESVSSQAGSLVTNVPEFSEDSSDELSYSGAKHGHQSSRASLSRSYSKTSSSSVQVVNSRSRQTSRAGGDSMPPPPSPRPSTNGHAPKGRGRQRITKVLEQNEEEEDDGDEEVTIIKRINRIYHTTINKTSSALDRVTPQPMQSALGPNTRLAVFGVLLILLLALLLPYLFREIIAPLLFYVYDAVPTLLSTIITSISLIHLPYFTSSPFSSSSALPSTVESDSTLPPASLPSDFVDMVGRLNQETTDRLNGIVSELERVRSQVNDLKVREADYLTRLDQQAQELSTLKKSCCHNLTREAVLDAVRRELSALLTGDQHKVSNEELLHPILLQLIDDLTTAKLTPDLIALRKDLDATKQETLQTLSSQLSTVRDNTEGLTRPEVQHLIDAALKLLDEDKTGQPDYALESSGGTIVTTRCSETFEPKNIQYKLFGITVWRQSVSPRAVIQPNIAPGECWAFAGTRGNLVIRLSKLIYPTAFTYEHTSKKISADGTISSAPREFQVRGLKDETDMEGVMLGSYAYLDNNELLQQFPVQLENPPPIQFLEMIVLSNHGNQRYTCLYRFRVHGTPVTTEP